METCICSIGKMNNMFRSATVFRKDISKRLFSSSAGVQTVPSNLRIPSNLVKLPRTKRPLPICLELPVLRKCGLKIPVHLSAIPVWLESFRNHEDDQLGLVELHPDVFAVHPRLDILHEVEVWQRNFKRISQANVKIRSEVRGGGRKPWNQKGTGHARHGSIRSPLWRGGGISQGPRGPTSYYYMLPMKVRVMGLKVALSSKMTQNDLHIVDSLEVPTPDPQYILDLAKYRQWGESILIVDVNEKFQENILQASARLKNVNLIPAIGLNVHSILKHETLVLTVEAVTFLENKMLWHDSRFTPLYPFKLPYKDFP